MPVVQLQDDSGANLGAALGAVGGYLASQKQRKADKQRTQSQEDQKAKDAHDDIQSAIAARTHTTQTEDANATNKQFQQGAYTKLLASLNGPKPPNTTAQQWVAYLQSRVLPMGLTDPDLQGKLYAAAQDYLAKDQATQNATFAGKEQQLPGDPAKQLAVLKKRLQIEKSKPGFDLKPTELMIADVQKQITQAQAAAHQAAIEKRQQGDFDEHKRHDLAIENRPREGRTPSAQEQYFVQHGYMPPSYAEAHPKDKPAPKQTTPQARGADYTAAAEAIQKGADRDAVVKRFAAKWQLAPDKADALFP